MTWPLDGPATFEDLMAAIYAEEERFVQHILEGQRLQP